MVLSYVGNQVEDTFQFLPVQKSGRTVGSLVRIGKVALAVVFSGVAVTHPHDHKDQQSQKPKADTNTVETVGKMKRSPKAGKKSWIRHLWGCSAVQCAAGFLPHLIVIEKL